MKIIKTTEAGTFTVKVTERLDTKGLHAACSIPSVKKDLSKSRARTKMAVVLNKLKGVVKKVVKR